MGSEWFLKLLIPHPSVCSSLPCAHVLLRAAIFFLFFLFAALRGSTDMDGWGFRGCVGGFRRVRNRQQIAVLARGAAGVAHTALEQCCFSITVFSKMVQTLYKYNDNFNITLIIYLMILLITT